jgi:hypothetical protein
MRYSIISFLLFFLLSSCTKNDDNSTTSKPIDLKYTLSVSSYEGGTVSNSGGSFQSGTKVSITATPNEGYRFLNWSDGSLDMIRNIIVDKEISITAIFEKLHYNLKQSEVLLDPNISGSSFIQNIPGMFGPGNIPSNITYKYNNQNYLLIAGNTCDGGECDGVESNQNVPKMPALLFKYDNNFGWKFIKEFKDATTWNIRNFDKKGDYIVMGDGNEIGNIENWKGDGYFGEIKDDDIIWTRINKDETRSYQHDISLGDLDGDDKMDVIVAPTFFDSDRNLYGMFKNVNGVFELKSSTTFMDGTDIPTGDSEIDKLSGMGLSCQIDDIDNDGVNEIIYSGFETYVFKFNGEKYQLHWTGDYKLLDPNSSPGSIGSTMINFYDINNDNIKDMLISREFPVNNTFHHSFDAWIGNGDGTFEPKSATIISDILVCREFNVIDANNDGFLDVILRANFGYYTYDGVTTDRGYNWGIFFDKPEPKGVILNELIWINDGTGKFSMYNEKTLFVDKIKPYQLIPYSKDDKLHFIGLNYIPINTPTNVQLKDGKIPINFYDIELEIN